MNPTVTLDTREFNGAAALLRETSRRTTADFINGQALRTSIEAVRRTKKADAAKIQHELGATAQGVSFRQISRGKNKGKWRTKRGPMILREDSLAARIIGWRIRKTGRSGVEGLYMREMAQNLIRARMRGVSFIASGWIHARNALFSVVRRRPSGTGSIFGARAFGARKGSAIPAREAEGLQSATITNTALKTESVAPSLPRNPMPVATRGLQAALDFVARDMMQELYRRLNPDFRKVSAK